MVIESINVERPSMYNGVDWKRFQDYGFNSPTEPFPYGTHTLRTREQREKTPLHTVGYGPVVISLLEDQAEFLINFLSTLDHFFNPQSIEINQKKSPNLDSFSTKDFLPGSEVFAVWATSAEDLAKEHKVLVEKLKEKGYQETDINFLNIFDNMTNHRIDLKEVDAGQKQKGVKSGGQKALEYIQQHIENNLSSATLIQSANCASTKVIDSYGKSLEELGSRYKVHNILTNSSKVDLINPFSWEQQEDYSRISKFLSELWRKLEIPFFNKLVNASLINKSTKPAEALEEASTISNRPLTQILKAFNIFVQDNLPKDRRFRELHLAPKSTPNTASV